jgi:hypothetical protein
MSLRNYYKNSCGYADQFKFIFANVRGIISNIKMKREEKLNFNRFCGERNYKGRFILCGPVKWYEVKFGKIVTIYTSYISSVICD